MENQKWTEAVDRLLQRCLLSKEDKELISEAIKKTWEIKTICERLSDKRDRSMTQTITIHIEELIAMLSILAAESEIIIENDVKLTSGIVVNDEKFIYNDNFLNHKKRN